MRRSLSARAYTMHSNSENLSVPSNMLPNDLEQVVRLTENSTEVVQDIYDLKCPVTNNVGKEVVYLLHLRKQATDIFHQAVRNGYEPVRPQMTYKKMRTLLLEADYRTIANALYFAYSIRYTLKEVDIKLSKEAYNSGRCRVNYVARLRAESNLHLKKQFNSYLRKHK